MASVLIIEDDQRYRLALKENLTHRGYDVSDACNGLEGINKFISDKPDIIVMDIIMPEKEGIETIREIKRDYPTAKIIAISGGGTLGPEHYLKVASAMGADKTLKKPFRTDILVGSIEELLSI